MTMSEHALPKKSVTMLSKRVCSINNNSRQIVKIPRNMTSRSPMSSLTSTSTSTSSTSLRHRSSVRYLLVTSIIVTVSLLGRANAGISFGGVTSTDACYSALESAAIPGENKVDKNGYVSFVNELSSDAFTSFRYNEKTDEWGMFPVVEFEELPSSIKGVFYKIACGGEYTICEEAYLYTDGIQDDTNPQDVVYLFELCNGVEDAIAEEKGDDNVATTTNGPTQTPTAEASLTTVEPTSVPGFTISTSTPTIASISEEILVLTYRAVVTDTITSSNLNDPTSAYRSQLLGAMSTWTMKTTSKVNNGSVERKRKREQQSRNNSRELLVYSKPLVETDGTSLMDVVDVECDAENATFMTDHCIEIKNTVILEFVNESPNSNHNSTLDYIEEKFETDINNGEFRNLILPTSTKEEFRLLYSSTDTTSTDENAALLNPDNLIDDGDKKKTNIIAIVASSCIVLLLIGVVVGLFIHRRHNYKADKSDAVDGTSERDGRESYATPDFDTPNDLEGGEKKRDVSKIFPVAESGSDSSSMESFSGSSSDDSSTSTSDSSADDESTGSSKYRSSTSEVGSAAEVYAAHGNSRASSRSSSRSSAKDRSRASSTPTDEDSSAGSSGWESSDGSSVDSASVESYKGDLTSLKSGSTSTTPIDGSIISSTSSSQELGRVANPQENNYAMDRG